MSQTLTPAAVLELLSRLLPEASSRFPDPALLRSVATLAQAQLRALELADIEIRLLRLEAASTAKPA